MIYEFFMNHWDKFAFGIGGTIAVVVSYISGRIKGSIDGNRKIDISQIEERDKIIKSNEVRNAKIKKIKKHFNTARNIYRNGKSK